MDSMVGSKIPGEDSQRLNNAMKDLAKNPTGADLDRAINEIADIRGVPADQLKADYQKFLQIQGTSQGNRPAKRNRSARSC